MNHDDDHAGLWPFLLAFLLLPGAAVWYAAVAADCPNGVVVRGMLGPVCVARP